MSESEYQPLPENPNSQSKIPVSGGENLSAKVQAEKPTPAVDLATPAAPGLPVHIAQGKPQNPYYAQHATDVPIHRNGLLVELEHGLLEVETTANNIWKHLASTSSGVVQTALGKIDNLHLFTPGSAESFWRRTFSPLPDEHFLNYFSCIFSTSAGLVAGTIFVSDLNFSFVADRPTEFVTPGGTLSATFHKVGIPLVRIGHVLKKLHPTEPNTKIIEIVTVENYCFWFANFLSYDLAGDLINWAVSNAVNNVAATEQVATNSTTPHVPFPVPMPTSPATATTATN